MTPQELTELKARCQTAKRYGRSLANTAALVAALEKEAGPAKLPPGVAKNSAGHLLALIEKVERVRSGQEAKPAPAPAPAAPPPPPPATEPEEPITAETPIPPPPPKAEKPKRKKSKKAEKAVEDKSAEGSDEDGEESDA